MAEAITHGSGRVVEHDDRITGYATDLGFTGHAVGESNDEANCSARACSG
jgi:hypothetical protein